MVRPRTLRCRASPATGAAPATRAPAPALRARAAAAWARGWPSAARADAGRVASRASCGRARYASASPQRAGGWAARPCEPMPATPCPAASPHQTAATVEGDRLVKRAHAEFERSWFEVRAEFERYWFEVRAGFDLLAQEWRGEVSRHHHRCCHRRAACWEDIEHILQRVRIVRVRPGYRLEQDRRSSGWRLAVLYCWQRRLGHRHQIVTHDARRGRHKVADVRSVAPSCSLVAPSSRRGPSAILALGPIALRGQVLPTRHSRQRSLGRPLVPSCRVPNSLVVVAVQGNERKMSDERLALFAGAKLRDRHCAHPRMHSLPSLPNTNPHRHCPHAESWCRILREVRVVHDPNRVELRNYHQPCELSSETTTTCQKRDKTAPIPHRPICCWCYQVCRVRCGFRSTRAE